MKAVFFDFDGTLTTNGPNIWREIWKSCGHSIERGSYYRKLYKMFLDKEITHQEWCDLSCVEYKKVGFKKQTLDELATKIKTINGLKETLEELKKRGYSLHVVSGNIVSVVKQVLGDNVKYFDSIGANEMFFDENGVITSIKGTKYDYEGKAKYVEEFAEKTNSSTSEMTFIGNSSNDEWVYQSGCRTICINPDETDAMNKHKWHICKGDINSFTEILEYF